MENGIADHVSKLESLSNRLEAMDSPIDEKMQVALLLVSVRNISSFEATTGKPARSLFNQLNALYPFPFVFNSNEVVNITY